MAERWRIQGTLFDACNCTTLCPCNYAQTPTYGECGPAVVWHVTKGNYGKTSLSGLNFGAVLYAKGNPLLGIDKLAVVLDEKATGAKEDALMKILGGQAGGMWAMMAKLVKSPPEVVKARIEYSNNGRSWSAKADGYFEIRGSYLQPPAEMGLKLPPRKAQTFDFLFAPTMEKVVGISESYRTNVAGLASNLSGRYSSSGKFDYKGP